MAPAANLLSITGDRLAHYNSGAVVPMYDVYGRNEFLLSNGGLPAVCAVRYESEAGGPVSDWLFCTDYDSLVCAGVNGQGQAVDKDGNVLPATNPVGANAKLDETEERMIVALVNGQWDYTGVGEFAYQTFGSFTQAQANGNSRERAALQIMVWCLSDPPTGTDAERLATCNTVMSAEVQAEILAAVPADPVFTIVADSPSVDLGVGSTAVFTVDTNIVGKPITLSVTGSYTGLSVVSGPGTLVGNELTVTSAAPVRIQLTGAAAGAVQFSGEVESLLIEQLSWHQAVSTVAQPCQIFATMFGEPDVLTQQAQASFIDPAIGTTLVDELDGDQYLVQAGGTVIDTVAYEGLIANTDYLMSGELVDQATGTPTGITGSTPFTSSATGSGTVEVEFTIPATWAGYTLVAFEVLSLGGTEITTHEDIDDEGQTVYIADIATTLLDESDGDSNIVQAGGTVIDTVAYTNLIPNTQYVMSGELIDQETGTPTGITGSTAFTSSITGDGEVEVEFVINDEWAGRILVAFEVLTQGGTEIAVHEDIDDEAQTVWIADIATTLLDELDGDSNLVQAGGTVIDTVAYTNLLPNTDYVMSGELIDQATGTPTGITGSTPFTSSDTGNGFVEVEFVISGDWAGATLVAFEVLSLGGTEIAVHEDIDDEAQTVWIADIGTTLLDAADGDKNVTATGGTVIDTVAYVNLLPNTEYTLTGELIDKESGEATGITGTTTFTSSDTGNGTAEVAFIINDEWAGHTLVAFEVLTLADLEIAVHEDINDEAQTIVVDEPVIETSPSTSTTPSTTTPGTTTPSSPPNPTESSPNTTPSTPPNGTTPSTPPGGSTTWPTPSSTTSPNPLPNTGVGAGTITLGITALAALLLGAGFLILGRRRAEHH